MSQLKATPGPWHFDRMDSAVKFAALKGETLAEHEGYFRDNNGDWIITFKDEDGESGGRVAVASFKGHAKRGETYKAPDPEGQANARLIAAAPDLYGLLVVLEWGDDERPGCPFCGMDRGSGHLERCQMNDALRKVRGADQ